MAKPKIERLPDLDHSKYYQTGIISKSSLWLFEQELSGARMMKAKPETLRFGQLVHEAIYEPALFVSSDEYVKVKATSGASSDEIKAINKIERMATVAKANPVLQVFLKHKQVEFEKPFWVLINGVPVQIKTDAFIPKFIHDTKTTACTNYDAFVQSCKEYGYFDQVALYLLVTGAKTMYLLGVKKNEPHLTFHVDSSKFKAEVKEGQNHILGLLDMYCRVKKNYVKNALKLFV